MSDTIGSVGVEVVPDARGFTEKLRAQLRDVKVTVNADADTGAAETKLDEVARTRTAKIKADTSQLSKGASALDKFVGNLGLLPSLAIAAGAALVPLAGTLGGIAAALAAPLVIAGGGATLFGVLAGFAVKDTEKQLKLISAAQTKLDGLTKGTKDYAAEQKHLHDLQKSLSPAQSQFAAAQGNLTGSFQDFIGGKAGTALLGPLTQGMNLLAHILPSLTPVLVAAGGAFSTLLGDIDKAASSPGFDKFIRSVSGQVGHDIVGFATAAGQIGKGLGGLFVQLDKSVGSSMVDQLVRLSSSFSDWANSKRGADAIQSFIGYFHKVGPQVGDTLGAVARAIGHIVHALAPLGPPVLRVIQGIADAIAGIPLPILTALAGAAAGLVAFQKVGGFKGLSALGKIGSLTGKGGPLGVIAGKAGVVPVFVTNEGFGGPGGGLGGPKGVLGKTIGTGALAFTVGDLAIAAGSVAITTGVAYELYKHIAKPSQQQAVSSYMQAHAGSNVGGPDNPASPKYTTVFPSTPGRSASKGEYVYNPNTKVYDWTSYATKSANAVDSIRTALGRVSRAEDMVGPHATQAAAVANRAFASVQAHLAAIRDKRINIVTNTADAIHRLEALQALTIRDKSFNVIQNNIERTVGPGGGMQRHARGGWVTGPGTGTSDSVVMRGSAGEFVVNARAAAQNRALLEQMNSGRSAYSPTPSGMGAGSGMVHTRVYLDRQQIGEALTPFMDDVYHANRNFEGARAGL